MNNPLSSSQGSTIVTTPHELELGLHTLFIMDDQSIDIVNLNKQQDRDAANNSVHLSSEETYRLFISLRELFK